jgi:teichuronic acid biosynthesis glycosyltransferase TuaH
MSVSTTTIEPPLTAATTAGADVIFTFSYVSWRAAQERGFFFPEDRLALLLLDDRRIGRLVIGDTMRNLAAKLVRDGLARGDHGLPTGDRVRLVSPLCLGFGAPRSARGALRAVAAYERALERTARTMGMNRPAVITGHPLIAGFGEFEWAGPVTYYGFDDWSRSPRYRRWWSLYEASYRLIRSRQRRVAAVTSELRDDLAPPDRSVLVPNGIEPEEWQADPTAFRPATKQPGPVLLYVGTLDYRLRLDWLAALARGIPEATLMLVGPDGGSGLNELRARENVVIAPQTSNRAEFAALIRSADVGLIPHHRTPLTERIEPQKVWEYLAGGLPVVSADLLPIRGIDPRVSLVADEEEFVAAVRSAIKSGRASEADRLAFVSANSWRARHDALIGLALS